MSVQLNANTPKVQTQSVVPSAPAVRPKEEGFSTNDMPLPKNGKEMHLAEVKGSKISIGDEQLVKAIERAAKVLSGPTTSVEMQVHKKTNDIVMKVINKETGDVIREVPPEKMLDLVAKMMEFAGILVDERV
ncbi:MAG: flagellar protein FlaG [Candidatus Cohnella colombiensis]|uniref:Flagellar protein FlaG n=1 Tax=Candidatus Cohnella colombiensis TaxID=3121368 RepID=A0AA95EYW0_9BACL|nr:MAG: flagellar protein FlaG [Cohnella sp.]